MSNGELGRLTPSERLLVNRRRHGWTQARAASEQGVSQTRYSRWERGLEPPSGPLPRVSPLRDHERCLLYRRRSSMSQARVAQEMGRCKMWVRQMERGEVDCSELIEYWEV